MIYQSTNNCKLNNPLQSKSMGKAQKKLTTYNQNISLEKHHNKNILLKTEAKGFYIEGTEDRLMGDGDSPRKNRESNWQSTNQLPFLLMTTNQPTENKNPMSKKKTQIIIAKNTSYKTNGQSNFGRR